MTVFLIFKIFWAREHPGTAIDIAENNKEGFQYLQTGFYGPIFCSIIIQIWKL